MSNDFRGNRMEINRLNRAIAAEEQTINAIFQRMWQIYFTAHREDAEESQAENIRGVQAALERARGYQEQINVLKGIAICPSCKAEVSINAAFCSRCGTRMPMKTPPAPPVAPNALVCPSCGNPCTAEMRFCNRCGTKLEKAPAAPAAPAAPEAPAAPVMQPPAAPFVPNAPSAAPQEPAEIPAVFSPIPQPVPQPVPPVEAESPAPSQDFTDLQDSSAEAETVSVSDEEPPVDVEFPDLPETDVAAIQEAVEAAAEALASAEAAPPDTPAEEVPTLEAVPIKRFCANCGTPLREGYRFCLNCGSPV